MDGRSLSGGQASTAMPLHAIEYQGGAHFKGAHD
jgi:hypothetical protein